MDNNYTLKTAKAEISKIQKAIEKKKEKINDLNKELRSDNVHLKEMEAIYDKLNNEDLQKKIAETWFKGNKLTGEQINKFLELSTKISDKIDILDVNDVVKAVATTYNEKKEKNGSNNATIYSTDNSASSLSNLTTASEDKNENNI